MRAVLHSAGSDRTACAVATLHHDSWVRPAVELADDLPAVAAAGRTGGLSALLAAAGARPVDFDGTGGVDDERHAVGGGMVRGTSVCVDDAGRWFGIAR